VELLDGSSSLPYSSATSESGAQQPIRQAILSKRRHAPTPYADTSLLRYRVERFLPRQDPNNIGDRGAPQPVARLYGVPGGVGCDDYIF
jgi:hypothetical protein